MGSEDCIDLNLKNIWKSWFAFRKGKRASFELHDFQYHLESRLFELFRDLNNGQYRHSGYRKFIICDNKRREISVASVRDRVVHRLVYDFLEKQYDRTFIYDAWSCRKSKGLLGAIERTQEFLERYNTQRRSHFSWVWKCDVKKFFDSVDQEVLIGMLVKRIKDKATLWLLEEILFSYSRVHGEYVGMPIGNLTSQIFANIYLNELDRFVKHDLKVKNYLRYGDDFIFLDNDLEKLESVRSDVSFFLTDELKLQVNAKSNKILKATQGLKFLGVELWLSGRTLNRRNQQRTKQKLKIVNISSYSGMVKKHGNSKKVREFNWLVIEKIINK